MTQVQQVQQETQSKAAETEQESNPLVTMLKPLVLDIAVPLGSYYLLHNGFGVGLVASLMLSSIVPAVRTVVAAARDRSFNGLAGIMLVVNLVGIVLSFVTGDARLMIVKDSALSSVVGISVLIAAATGKPLMSVGLKPFMTKGKAANILAWDRLSAGSARFRRAELLFSTIWGVSMLSECVARIVLAFILPVSTMVWLSTVLLIASVLLAAVVGGIATNPIERMIADEVKAADEGAASEASAMATETVAA
ncbi:MULTISPECIES: VC0807 family protein [unclassified Streptomyces]|uniref:VC0807 family protein n=1 Tax=unclassified Streptomyces TaxID=2593676 RepID=UPI001EF29F27|nr:MULTISPECIES: VC0807 family protein [unclassified Streptomyces]